MDRRMHQAQGCIGSRSRGLKHQFLINQTVAKDAQVRCTKLAMAWIDYKKAYNSVPEISNFHKAINVALENNRIPNSKSITDVTI